MRKVIEVSGISKQYRLGKVGTGAFAEDVQRLFAKVMGKPDPFADSGDVNHRDKAGSSNYVWALKDISFDVNQGDVLGIIGRNGAGKSTLLKILARVSEPTKGSFRLRGRVASLLEVGTGFHPDLSGRENIYINGSILGMTRKEITSRFDEIVSFSGIERYIDTPIKRYSSGMKVRLGFAIAAHLEPEILIVDEVLAVGDAEFQSRCISKMQDVAGGGRTVLFVSHNLSAVRNLCTRGIVIENGILGFEGTSSDAISYYRRASAAHVDSSAVVECHDEIDGPFQFTKARFTESDTGYAGRFEFTESVGLVITVRIKQARSDSMIGIFIEDAQGNCVLVSTNNENDGTTFLRGLAPGDYSVQVNMPGNILKPGEYWVTLAARGQMDKAYHRLENCMSFEIVDTKTYRGMKDLYRKQAVVAPVLSWTFKGAKD